MKLCVLDDPELSNARRGAAESRPPLTHAGKGLLAALVFMLVASAAGAQGPAADDVTSQLAGCDTGAPLVDNAGTPACGAVLTRDLSDPDWTNRLRMDNLPLGTVPGQPLVSGTTNPAFGVPSIRSYFDLKDDFCGAGSASHGTVVGNGWGQSLGGASSDEGAYAHASSNKLCVYGLLAGTSATGYTILRQAYHRSPLYSVQGGETFIVKLAVGPAISGGGDDYDVVVGLTDVGDGSALDPHNGVYFLYDADDSTSYPGAASANWWAITENVGDFDPSAHDSGVPVAAVADGSGTFQTLMFTINASRTQVDFYVDGNGDGRFAGGAGVDYHVAERDNIPAGAVSPTIAIVRTANSATTQRTLFVDYVQFSAVLPSLR